MPRRGRFDDGDVFRHLEEEAVTQPLGQRRGGGEEGLVGAGEEARRIGAGAAVEAQPLPAARQAVVDDGADSEHPAERRRAGLQRRLQLTAETADLLLVLDGERRLQQPAPVAQRGAAVVVAFMDLQGRRERLAGSVELLQQEVDAAEELLGVAEDAALRRQAELEVSLPRLRQRLVEVLQVGMIGRHLQARQRLADRVGLPLPQGQRAAQRLGGRGRVSQQAENPAEAEQREALLAVLAILAQHALGLLVIPEGAREGAQRRIHRAEGGERRAERLEILLLATHPHRFAVVRLRLTQPPFAQRDVAQVEATGGGESGGALLHRGEEALEQVPGLFVPFLPGEQAAEL